MAGRKRSDNERHPADQQTKRSQRGTSSGEHGTVPQKSSRQAGKAAGDTGHGGHAPEVDETSASKSFGIEQSAQRHAGVSIPDSAHQKRG